MNDYADPVLRLENQVKHIYEHLINGKLEEALNITDLMQFEVLNIRSYCIRNIKIDGKTD